MDEAKKRALAEEFADIIEMKKSQLDIFSKAQKSIVGSVGYLDGEREPQGTRP